MIYSIERALAYQNLMRWHETNKAKLKGVCRHDADWLLASLVIGALPSDLMQPTPTELTAAEILRLICAIETSIETGNARKLCDGIPEIITLEKYLKLSVNDLENMTECYPVSIKEKTRIEHYATYTGGDSPKGEPPCLTAGMVTITRLAITAAWEIEGEVGRIASAKEVIKRLQDWVASNRHEELIETIPHGVKWMTTKADKNYDIDACQATLKSWHSNRKKTEPRPSLKILNRDKGR